MWLERDAHGEPVEAVIARPSVGELRFAPGGEVHDARGGSGIWRGSSLCSPVACAGSAGRAPLSRCARARVVGAAVSDLGEVLLSAAPGYEFLDWGGQAHVGGGSHGSLRGEDSLGALILCGLADGDPPAPEVGGQWSIRDVAPLIRAHFGSSRAESQRSRASESAR